MFCLLFLSDHSDQLDRNSRLACGGVGAGLRMLDPPTVLLERWLQEARGSAWLHFVDLGTGKILYRYI